MTRNALSLFLVAAIGGLAQAQPSAEADRYAESAKRKLKGYQPLSADGDWYGALADYVKAIELDPKNPQRYADRASLWKGPNKPLVVHAPKKRGWPGPLADYAKAIELDPKCGQWWFERGDYQWTVLQEGNRTLSIKEAIRCCADFQQAVRWGHKPAKPKLLEAMTKLAELTRDTGDYARAEKVYTRIFTVKGRSGAKEWTRRAGRALMRLIQGKFDGAISDLSFALRYTPASRRWGIHASLGRVLLAKGDRAGARAAFQKSYAGRKSPFTAMWLAGAGDSSKLTPHLNARKRGWGEYLVRYWRGVESKSALLAKARADKNANDRLCEAYGFMGLKAEADRNNAKAIEYYRACAKTRVHRYVEYVFAKARLSVLKSEGGAPSTTPAPRPVAMSPDDRRNAKLYCEYNATGKLLQDQADKAIAAFNRAIHRYPAYGPAYRARGIAKHIHGDFAGAQADLKRALSLDPKDLSAHARMGLLRLDQGDYRGAINDLNTALRLEPLYQVGLVYRGFAKAAIGDLRGARADLERAIQIKDYSKRLTAIVEGLTTSKHYRWLENDRIMIAAWLSAVTLDRGRVRTVIRKYQEDDWSAKIVRFQNGQLGEKGLSSSLDRKRCAAYGQFAIKADRFGERAKAIAWYRKCLEVKVTRKVVLERVWAKVRLRALKAMPKPGPTPPVKPAAPPPTKPDTPTAGAACAKCKASLPKGSKFCSQCGAKVVTGPPKCVKCSKVLPKGSKFCNQCGAKQ